MREIRKKKSERRREEQKGNNLIFTKGLCSRHPLAAFTFSSSIKPAQQFDEMGGLTPFY